MAAMRAAPAIRVSGADTLPARGVHLAAVGSLPAQVPLATPRASAAPQAAGARGCPALAAATAAAALAQQARRRRPTARRATATLEREEDVDKKVESAPAAPSPDFGEEFKKQVVDEEALLAESTFPIKPADLIIKCKDVLSRGAGTLKGGEDDLADDFEFCAPFVGPLPKAEYLGALGTFKIQDAFPDTNPNYHFFRVDPFEPSRVWFQTRKTGTNTGDFMGKPATGKALQFPPESYSLVFNEQGKVKEFTVGYVIDRRVGNTGGLGGAFGYFYGVGNPLPIPECKPYKRSLQFRFLGFMGRLQKRFQKK